MPLLKVLQVICVLSTIFISNTIIAQTSNRTFAELSQTYYLVKDKDVVEKTIDFINHTPIKASRFEPVVAGFWGAIFITDTTVKNQLLQELSTIEKPELRELFKYLTQIILTAFILRPKFLQTTMI